MNKCMVAISYGDNDAFVKLYETTKKGIYAFLYSYYQNAFDKFEKAHGEHIDGIKDAVKNHKDKFNGR